MRLGQSRTVIYVFVNAESVTELSLQRHEKKKFSVGLCSVFGHSHLRVKLAYAGILHRDDQTDDLISYSTDFVRTRILMLIFPYLSDIFYNVEAPA